MDKLYGNQREAVHIGYLAGLFDGEGSVMIHRTNSHPARKTPAYGARVQVGMAHEETVKLFESRYGGKIREERVPNRRLIYRWQLNKMSEIVDMLNELVPLLIEKKDRAILALDFIEHMSNYKRQRDEKGRVVTTSDEELAIREDFYQRMKELHNW